MKLRLAMMAALTVCIAAASPPAEAPRDTAYSLGDAGELHVALPAGWTGKGDGAAPTTIQLLAPEGKHVSIQLTPVPGKTADADLQRATKLIGSRYASGSKEKTTTTLIPVKGTGVRGYLSAYTDAAE